MWACINADLVTDNHTHINSSIFSLIFNFLSQQNMINKAERAANKVLLYSAKLTTSGNISKIRDIVIHRQKFRTVLTKTYDNMVMIDHHSTSPKSQLKTKKLYSNKTQGLISNQLELETIVKLSQRMLKYAEVVKTEEVSGEILYVEISADDDQQTRLIILVNHSLEFRRIDLNTVAIEKLKNQIGKVQDVLTDQITKQLEEREMVLSKLQEDCENMSHFASSFADSAKSVKIQEHTKERCACCLFWFPSCKGCCLKLSVCCGKCKRCQCCEKDNDDDGWVRDQNGNWFNRNERNDNKKKPTKRIDYKTDSMVRSVKRNNREQLEYLEQKGIIT